MKKDLTIDKESDKNLKYSKSSAKIKDAPRNIAKILEKHSPTVATILSDPAIDLNSEFFSARLEDGLSEATRALPTPLAMEPARLIEPVRDLKADACFARPEAIFQFVVRVVEQE